LSVLRHQDLQDRKVDLGNKSMRAAQFGRPFFFSRCPVCREPSELGSSTRPLMSGRDRRLQRPQQHFGC
jgi:hypothetical protein